MYKLLRKHGETKGNTMKRFETLLCRFFFDEVRQNHGQDQKERKTCKSKSLICKSFGWWCHQNLNF